MKYKIKSGILLIISALALAFTAPAHATSTPESFAPLVEKLTPAVVNISTTQKVKGMKNPMFDMPQGDMEQFKDFFERFGSPFGMDKGASREVYSLGSGFIIDKSGYVVTNNHVIADADEVHVILADDTKLKATVIGRDPKTDLALMKVESKKELPFVTFGNSDEVKVGDWVIAIGNPFGLGGTVTAGIISARARNINSGPFDDFLQTDAAINRGNSGGPMFNIKGEVIGINSAIFSPSGGNIGIGFAVPSALAEPVIRQLRETGKIERGWLGVKIQHVTDEIADSLGLSDVHGALVLEVNKDSPAEKAGVKVGDVILSFGGKEVKEMRTLPRMVADTKIGASVPLLLWRDGKTKEAVVTLGQMKDEEEASADGEDGKPSSKQSDKSVEFMGMQLAPLDGELREELSVEKDIKGVAILEVDPESEAAKRRLGEGDVILQVDGKTVSTPADVKSAVEAVKKSGKKFALLRVLQIVSGGREEGFITLPTDGK